MKNTRNLGRAALAVALFALPATAEAQLKPVEPVKPSVRPELRELNLKPDLVIRKFRLKSYGPCKPRRAVLTFEAVIANTGNAPASLSGGAIVKVAEKNGAGPWSGGASLKRPIPPGATATVSVPLY
ncbi:MAG: hypothetical protein ACLFV8_08270, partial [Alphaproteobacteria bacterium]